MNLSSSAQKNKSTKVTTNESLCMDCHPYQSTWDERHPKVSMINIMSWQRGHLINGMMAIKLFVRVKVCISCCFKRCEGSAPHNKVTSKRSYGEEDPHTAEWTKGPCISIMLEPLKWHGSSSSSALPTGRSSMRHVYHNDMALMDASVWMTHGRVINIVGKLKEHEPR